MAVTFPVGLGGNGQTYDDSSFALGGHRTNFIPVLEQVVVMAETTTNNSLTASNAATTATTQAGIATGAASSALTSSQGAQNALEDIQDIADDVAATAALIQAVSGAKSYATYALALADIGNLTNNQVVVIAKDETKENLGTYYKVTSGVLEFLRFEEVYISPVSYIPNQSFNQIITTLLVKAGMIPQDNPSLFGDFANDAYFN